MGMNLRYSPLEWEQNTNSFNFGGAQLENFVASRVFGQTFWVDGTEGGDSDNGLTLDHAFKTVQKAITAQLAHRAQAAKGYNRGDKIIIMPGTYAEALTGDLTNCMLLGGMPSNPDAVMIKPTTAGAYAGSLTNAVVDGISFYSSSLTNPTYAAFRARNMTGSTINNCHFYAGIVDALSTGFRVGEETSTSNGKTMSCCKFTNNLIGVKSNISLRYGFVIGVTAVTDANDRKGYVDNTLIAGNNICGELYGTRIGALYTYGAGTIIRDNWIHGGMLYAGECHEGGLYVYDRGHNNKLFKTSNNRISSHDTPVQGIQDGCNQGNITSTANATPVQTYPASS